MMVQYLEPSIVRIRSVKGRIVGAGFLVDKSIVLTCAHVLASALKDLEGAQGGSAGEVLLDFPLLDEKRVLGACITHLDIENDVAGLELINSVPGDGRTASLIVGNEFWGHRFRTFGFPTSYDKGVWASGVLRGRIDGGWVQVEDIKGAGYLIQPGFSGTPVWDEQLNGVVGIVVAADSDRVTKAGFMIPARAIIESWPKIAERSLESGSLEHLRMRLARLMEAQSQASDPSRFQVQIDALQERIDSWDQRIILQRERIAEGLKAQRRQMAEEQVRRHQRERLQVVGQAPLDVTGYFKDRERDLDRLGQLLTKSTTRLVSVIGHGGMGKTALACKLLQDLESDRWPDTAEKVSIDGIVYLSTRTGGISLERLFLDCIKLLSKEEQERLGAVWASPQLDAQQKVTRLLQALSEGRYVVLLDNLEDLLDDEGRLADSDLRVFFKLGLRSFQGTQLIVTSRVAPALEKEVMRFNHQVKLLEGLPVDEGVTLLRELDPNGDYGLRDAPEGQLAKAVDLAHGVPRALEVLSGILANNPFVTLDEVLVTFYEQEDVVQALIEENYKRMDPEALRVIEALAVFRRPVPVLAVDYLLAPFFPGLDVPTVVTRLTRTNIVNVDRVVKTITLHPIDQDYAYSQLLDENETGGGYSRQALERHAASYYAQLRIPEESWKSIDDLEPQLLEFEHRFRARDYDEACRILNSIDYDYLYKWGHHPQVIGLRERLSPYLTSPVLQATNWGSLGNHYRILGEIKQAIKLYEQALRLMDEVDDFRGKGFWLGNLGSAYRDSGQFEKAITYYEEALSIAREFEDRRGEALNLARIGFASCFLGELDRAVVLHEEASKIAHQIGDRRREGVFRSSLSLIKHSLGQHRQAVHLEHEALRIAREIGNRWGEVVSLGNLGIAYRALGLYDRAVDAHEQGLIIARECGNLLGVSNLLAGLGNTYMALGQVEGAIAYYEQSLVIARDVGNKWRESHNLVSFGRALLFTNDLLRAQQCSMEALTLDIPDFSYLASLVLSMVQLRQQGDDANEAFADCVVRCRQILEKTESMYRVRYALATALLGQAVCDSQWGNEDGRTKLLAPVLDEYRCALDISSAPGVVQEALDDVRLILESNVHGIEPVLAILNRRHQLDMDEA